MRLKPYPTYKVSSLPWLGQIPTHWDVRKLKFVASLHGRIGFHGLSSGDYRSEGIILVGGTNFQSNSINWQSCHRISEQWYEMDRNIQLRNGDLLVTKDGTIGKTAIVKNLPEKAVLNSGVIVVRPLRNDFGVQYLLYIINSRVFSEFIDLKKTGATIQHLYEATFYNFAFPIPPREEQQAIADFLDYIDRRINHLIRTKRRLIELLNEQKQAIIHRAVTRGLDPETPLKPSGIDWLGDIPEHWMVLRVKQCAQTISKGTTPSTEGREILDAGPVRFLKAENINSGRITDTPMWFIDDETHQALKRSQLAADDVLFVIAGATLGKTAIVRDVHLPANTNQAVSFIRPNARVVPDYLELWLQSSRVKELIWLNAVQSAQPNLSMADLGNFVVPLPHKTDQCAILEWLKSHTKEISRGIESAKREIDLIREYRTRLIADVVTGKLDVRDVRLPVLEAAAEWNEIVEGDGEEEYVMDIEEAEE